MTSELKVDKITPASGTSGTIGDSGDTFTVPSGATLTASAATVNLPTSIITGASEKTTLVDADKFLIADSADSNAFKHVQKSNLPSGTHALLEAINISSQVSHIDTSAFISSTYKTYLIIGRMFRPQDNATNIRFRGIEVGGSLMNATNYNYQQLYVNNGGVGRNYHSSASYVQMADTISSSVDNGAFNFALYFNCDRATGSDAAMTYYWQGGGATGGDAIYFAGGGWYDGVISNDPPEKLRFYFDSGDIHSGKITIFGITGAL